MAPASRNRADHGCSDSLGAARNKCPVAREFAGVASRRHEGTSVWHRCDRTSFAAILRMARTHKKVGYSPTGKLEDVTPDMAARGVEGAFRMLEGRWKMVIIFHLFARGTLRFSELEKAIPGVSQKMLIQQLRELERDGIVSRTVYPQVPPKVEYDLTKWGQAMCPALDSSSNGRRCGRSNCCVARQTVEASTTTALGQKRKNSC